MASKRRSRLSFVFRFPNIFDGSFGKTGSSTIIG